jgi:crotonobetainyl-CoA:carnitine CoA-transferase CaiB-like acyl-CoA transferase
MNDDDRKEGTGILTGLTVVEWGGGVSVPYCTKLLVGMGAEVIKVEPPDCGDESRAHGPFPHDEFDGDKSGLFNFLNAGKLSITLRPDDGQGKDILLKMLERADILVEDNPPSLLEKFQLKYDSLERVNPRLVVTSITPFGHSGPYRDYKGYDINSCAMGGVSWAIGDPEREPLSLPLSQAHYQSGANAAAATMVALLSRETTGKGQHVDISEVDVLSFYAGSNSLMYVYQGNDWRRAGHRAPDSGGSYPYTLLPCKDGYICMIARSGQEWNRVIKMLGDPRWAKDPRYQNRQVMGREYPDEVDALILPWLEERTKDEVFQLCREHGVPFAPVRDIGEIFHDEHFEQRGFFVEAPGPSGEAIRFPGAPFRFSETPWEVKGPAPRLGQHNTEIFSDRLGYPDSMLKRLKSDGVL